MADELKDNTEDYNDEPVFYCNGCLSLRVVSEFGLDYCDSCGSTDIVSSSFEEWEERYSRKYGKKFCQREEPPKKRKRI